MFLLAVLVYGEAFTSDKAITFAFIGVPWSSSVLMG